jgi:hypothetical protein
MALYTMTNSEILSVPEANFAAFGIKERRDLQRLLRAHVDVIAPNVLVIAEEFGNWDNANRRIDLLAVDSDANLVVIELKRDPEGGHMELQALRYAAMVARMTFDQAVEAYREYLESIGSPLDAQASLLDFLGWPEPNAEAFAQDVRVVLVAAGFSQEITSTVLWLNDRNLDIRCVRLKPYHLDSKIILNVEHILPLPEAAAYQIQIRQKQQEERDASRKQRGERVLDSLVARGILRPGARLQLVRPPRAGLNIPDKAKHATFEGTGPHGIMWDYDGQRYSVSRLCEKLCDMDERYIGAGPFRGPDYWGLQGESLSLAERAAALCHPSASQEAHGAPQVEARPNQPIQPMGPA